MSDTCRVQSPYVFFTGKKENARFDFIEQLRDGDLLSGVPVVEEVVGGKPMPNGTPGAVLTIGTPERNTSMYTSEHGITVEANQAVEVPITVLKGKKGQVIVRVSCDTTDARRTVAMEFAFEARD